MIVGHAEPDCGLLVNRILFSTSRIEMIYTQRTWTKSSLQNDRPIRGQGKGVDFCATVDVSIPEAKQ